MRSLRVLFPWYPLTILLSFPLTTLPRRFYNICPDTQPSLIGISEVLAYIADLEQPWSSCSAFMSAYSCTSELNFSNIANGPFLMPNDLPPSGTASLSVIGGTVSAPPLGTLFSYTNSFDSAVYTITAAIGGKAAGVGGVTGISPSVATNTITLPQPTVTLKSGAVAAGKTSTSWMLAGACMLFELLA